MRAKTSPKPTARHDLPDGEGACLSASEISRLALAAPFLGDRAEHLVACLPCTTALQLEMERLRAARHARGPQTLRLTQRPWWRQARWWAALGFASIAAAVSLFLPPAALAHRQLVYATVLRGSAHATNEVPLASVGPLLPHDRVRLRISDNQRHDVRVESQASPGWETLLDAEASPDGWLPGPLDFVARPRAPLRITACVDAQRLESCESQTINQ